MLLIWFIICFVQLFFLFLAFIAFFDTSVQTHIKTRKHSLPVSVSIVICAHNEEQNLRVLLPLLYQQIYFQKEIIIIDDHSSDNTHYFLKQAAQDYPEVKYLKMSDQHIPSGKKNALQLGIRLAQHDIILLTDADCQPNSQYWISSMCSPFDNQNTQIVLGYAPYFKEKGFLNDFIRYETLYTGIFYLSAALLGFPYMGVGRNLAYRRSLFLNNHGFSKHDTVLSGDDDLFVNRIANRKNTKVTFSHDAQVKSIPQSTWKNFLRQKHRHLEAGKYYKFSDKLWIGTAVLSHLFFWICFCLFLLYNISSPCIIFGGFLIRTICLIIVFKYISNRLNDKINLGSLVILDFLYVIYYVFTGSKAFFFKKRQWK